MEADLQPQHQRLVIHAAYQAKTLVAHHVLLGDFMLHLVSYLNTDLLHVKEAALVVRNEPRVTQWIGYSSAALAVIAALSVAYEGQRPHLASVSAERLLCRPSQLCLWLKPLHSTLSPSGTSLATGCRSGRRSEVVTPRENSVIAVLSRYRYYKLGNMTRGNLTYWNFLPAVVFFFGSTGGTNTKETKPGVELKTEIGVDEHR